MNKRVVWFGLALLILSAAIVFAEEHGKNIIVLDGGKQGNITFPHHEHQTIINDCMVCHADFAKEPGALLKSKNAGILKKKQVMNNTCLKCHRDRQKAGEKYGPVKCTGCHVK